MSIRANAEAAENEVKVLTFAIGTECQLQMQKRGSRTRHIV